MKKPRLFELVIVLVLTLISFAGNYYLKEPLVKNVTKQSLQWYLLDMVWLLLMIAIGYYGLKYHEFKWLRPVWLIVNGLLLLLLLVNKVTLHYLDHSFVMESAPVLLRTPFFYLMAAYLPRWFMRYKPDKGN